MNTNNTRPCMTRFWTLGLLVLAVSLGTAAWALDTAALDKEVSATLDQFYTLNEQHKSLVSSAAGVLVFPSITKAGVGVGGEHGNGALLQNGKTVGYYSTSGASVGLTLGASRHSEVVLFNTKEALDKFLNSKGWSIGADASVAVMKTGAGGRYDTQSLSKPVLAFVFGNKGLMGDVSLAGGKINKLDTSK
jgi:lipid-binding SYLF domain-containing protein